MFSTRSPLSGLSLRLSIEEDDMASAVVRLEDSPASFRSSGTVTPEFSGLRSPESFEMSWISFEDDAWREGISKEWRVCINAFMAHL